MSHSEESRRRQIVVHYWASAKAAAGTAQDVFDVDGPITLADVVRRVLERHDTPRLKDVIGACSTLVGEAPVGSRPAGDVVVHPGETVEFLPPFAGG